LYFLLHSTFFKGKEKSGVFGGFIVFLSGLSKKTGVCLVRSNYINPEDNYGRLIDFVRQISKLSFFNVLI